MNNKQAQVTIFVLIALVIVAGVALIFLLSGKESVEAPREQNPRAFIRSCVSDEIQATIQTILENGGQINQSQTISFNGLEYNYLCYQADYYANCYNIHPMLELQIEEEIQKDTSIFVENCFEEFTDDRENQGFSITATQTEYKVDVLPGSVEFTLQKELAITREQNTQSFEDFNGNVPSSLYGLIQVTRDIVNSESQFCNFEYNGYMLLYPQYNIKRTDYDGSKLYNVIDRSTQEEFRFAVRSCAFPPGI